jgi:two-component system cell cycle response regulator
VSRLHAQIFKENDHWKIRDLQSSNGTFVNYELTAERHVQGGDTITTGATTFKFLVASQLEKDFYERIYQMTSRDGLTKALNKAFFSEIASSELARSLLYHRPLCFCMIDLDHFKHCNDQYGHAAGDFVLKEWTQLIEKNIRSTDILGRLGGEEFGLLLTEQGLQQAEFVVSRLLDITRERRFEFENKIIPVTFSAGIVELTENIRDLETLIKTADEKLYKAKQDGRNRLQS